MREDRRGHRLADVKAEENVEEKDFIFAFLKLIMLPVQGNQTRRSTLNFKPRNKLSFRILNPPPKKREHITTLYNKFSFVSIS